MGNSGARKIRWSEVGRVAEPGRYLFTFGWLTISPDDLAIWRDYPQATFTLVAVAPMSETPDEFRLGTFDMGAYVPGRPDKFTPDTINDSATRRIR